MDITDKERLREAIQKELLTFCKHYSPDKSWKNWDTYEFWLVEKIWIDAFTSGVYSFIEECLVEYIKSDDYAQTINSRIPLSLRAILFDFYQHNHYDTLKDLGKDYSTPITFTEFLTNYNC